MVWKKLYIDYLKSELAIAERQFREYAEFWERFINYCHTGK